MSDQDKAFLLGIASDLENEVPVLMTTMTKVMLILIKAAVLK